MAKKMEFFQLTPERLSLLLRALDIDLEDKECHYCKESLMLEHTCLFPSLPDDKNKSYLLCCDSPLCVTLYLDALNPEGEDIY